MIGCGVMRGLRLWTEKEDQILRDYYPNGGYRVCMKLLPKRSKAGLINRAVFLGIRAGRIATQELCPYCKERPLKVHTCGYKTCQAKRYRMAYKKIKQATVEKRPCLNPKCKKMFIPEHHNVKRQNYCSIFCQEQHYRDKKKEEKKPKTRVKRSPSKSPPLYPCLKRSAGGLTIIPKRDFDCIHYEECLDFAVKKYWSGFVCKVDKKVDKSC